MRQYAIICMLALLILGMGACCNRAFGQSVMSKDKNDSVTPKADTKSGQDETLMRMDNAGNSNTIITRLPNGLLVYIFRDARFPLVCTRLYVRAGSADENPRQAGISHLLEHMVFKGTSHRPKGQVARDVESLGGYLNAATSFDKTWYLTDMPAAHWRTGMDVVKDMAFQATLDAGELESEKEVVISELQRGEDSPMRKLYENLQVAALKNTPYGRPIIGYENTIRAITAQDLKDYVKKWYQPQNMMLLVGGDIKPAEVLEYANELFGGLKNSSDLEIKEPFNLSTAALGSAPVEIRRGPWNKVYLGVAMPAPSIANMRSVDLDVLCYLLAGDGTSTLYKKYKYDEQLVDDIDISNMSMSRAGLLSITAELDADKVERFWTEFTKDLASLKAADFRDDAIARAKFNLEDSMDRAGETLNGLASWRGTIQFELGGEMGERNLRFAQQNVDRPQIGEAISQWFDSGQARVCVMAPENAQLPDLEGIMRKNWPSAMPQGSNSRTNSTGLSSEMLDLGNGCALILIPDNHAPYISIKLLMPGGNALLKSSQQGLARLTAALLTDGAGDYGKQAMERWLAERAASVSATSGIQTFGISLTGPSRFNEDLFKMLRDILRRPKFATDEFKREQDDMIAALARRQDQPLAYMFARINPFLFPDNQLYGYDSLGTEQSIRSFNVVNVRDFWTMQSAMPWTLAIAGSFDREAVLQFCKSLPAPHVKPPVVAEPVWGKDKTLNLTLPGRSQAHLMRIFKTVALDHPDAPALMLLQSVLSGQSGLLFTELRDKEGLGYTVTAINRNMALTGFMAFYIGTTADKLAQAGEGFSKIIDRIKSTPLDKDLLRAGANTMLGDYLRGRQSLASRAGEAAVDKVMNYPEDFQKLLVERAAELTPEDLVKVAQKYLVNPYDVTLVP